MQQSRFSVAKFSFFHLRYNSKERLDKRTQCKTCENGGEFI